MNFPKSGEIPRPDEGYINIPFAQDMENAILQGKKIKTARNTQYPEGSMFQVHGRTFKIMRVWPTLLATVAEKWYHDEGFESQDVFERRWRQLHRGHFNPGKIVWLHSFEEIDLTYPLL